MSGPLYSSYNGRFKPRHPEKYRGDAKNIIYRSFLELKMMLSVDADPSVEWWSSEETVVPYISPVDGQRHRYFSDFLVKSRDGKPLMIEVKPSNQTVPPIMKTKKPTKRYIEEVARWGINQAKWAAAKKWCDERDWKFTLMTEIDLGVSYGRRA